MHFEINAVRWASGLSQIKVIFKVSSVHTIYRVVGSNPVLSATSDYILLSGFVVSRS